MGGMRRTAPLSIDLTLPIDKQPFNLTVPEAAAYLRRSTRCLAHWEAKGLIRVLRPAGGFPLIPRSEVERILREGV